MGEPMFALSLSTIAMAALMTFAAAYVRGLTGFGMAIILVPLLGLAMPPEQAVVLGILLQLLIGPVGLRQTLQIAERETALPLGLIAILFTPIGMVVLAKMEADAARLFITATAVGAFIAVLLPKSRSARKSGKVALLLTGAASGVLTGFAAMPGPPVVPYYMRRNLTPQATRASMLTIFFMTAIAGSVAAIWLGIATWPLFILSLILFPPMWLGNRIGGSHFGKVKPHIWQAMVALVLGIAALSAVLRAF